MPQPKTSKQTESAAAAEAEPTSQDVQPDSTPEPEPVKYALEALVADSDAWFGVESHVAAGALSEDRRRRNFSLDEARELISGWDSRPVETEES